MNKYSLFVGIDVSKLKLDVSFIIDPAQRKHQHFIVENNEKGIKELLKSISKLKIPLEKVLICFENTGVYSMPLCCYLAKVKANFSVVAAIEIKRSKGISRGKNDRADSRDIAFYAYSHLHKIVLSSVPEDNILKLKVLIAERDKTLNAIKQMSSTKENTGFLSKDILNSVLKENKKIVAELKKYCAVIDKKMLDLIKSDVLMKEQFELITSIPGIGAQTAIYLIVTTRCFKAFDNWRQLACYAGVAPFENSSGSSLKGKSKVSNLADKKMKSLLNMCALNAKKKDTQLKLYYCKKTEEGKNKMLVLNNLRCKLLARVFAVINRKTAFVDIYRHVA